MTQSRFRLVLAVCLFLGWIGYLLFLVIRTHDPVILSRPQFLETDVVVVATLREERGKPHPDASVTDILWAADGAPKPQIGNTLRLVELADIAAAQGWRGPGDYLIPLKARGSKEQPVFGIPAIPWSPGFNPLLQVEIDTPTKKDVLQWIEEKTSLQPSDWNSQGKDPLIVRRNVTRAEFDELEKELRKLGAVVHKERPGEYRIYRATDDAKEQLRSIMAR